MIQRARIAFSGQIHDAAALDLSHSGARFRLPQAVAVPEQVQLHLPNGAIVTARRCWRQDEQIGFAFVAPHED